MTLKGHLCGGEVEFGDGRRFPVSFFDPVRVAQDVEMTARQGDPGFIEPALVVVTEVTRDVILRVLPELVRQRFFEHLRPLIPAEANGAVR